MRTALVTLPLLAIFVGCSGPEFEAVRDVAVCKDRVEARLFENRELLPVPEERGPEFYVLDANFGGDLNLASAFMRKNGWIGWASTKPEDKNKLYLVPNDGGFRGDEPIGDPSDGPELACRASKISGVPFVSVVRRSKNLSRVIYEFQP